MDRDRISATLLRFLYLRWNAAGRSLHPEAATATEIASCVDAERWLLHDLLADLTAVGLVERVETSRNNKELEGYRISGSGRHVVLTDRNTQRRSHYDH